MDEAIEQPINATPTDNTPVDNTDTGLLDGMDAPQDAAPAQPSLEDLFKDPEPEAPATPETPAAVPPEFQQALGISEYVKDATHLAGAVTLADAVLKVQNGHAPISGLLENFRAQNEAGYAKTVRENLIPYVEHITGMKLMDPSAAPQTEKTPEQQRIDAIEAQFQKQDQDRQQAVLQQQIQQAQGVLLQAADNALKGTWLEGKGKEYIAQLAPHMGMSEQQATQALLSGNTAMVDKAVKSMMAQKEAEGRAYAKWKIAESKTLKSGLPAGKGNPRQAAPGELPEGASMAEKIAYLHAE